jgi:EmrB/QacA subfamily drug resistance transporter
MLQTASGRRASSSIVLAVICTGVFVAALDQTVIYGALPDMMPDIRISVFELDQAAWIVIGYLLGYTVAMPLMGRVSDVYGHGRVYIASAALFMLGSVFVALSSNLHWMVGARVFQAIGGGAMVPIAMAIAGDIFPRGGRAVALGIIGGVVEAGGALGPMYGALFAHYLDWRWIFWINIPISVVVILLVYLLVGPGHRASGKIDYIGGVLLAASLALLSLALCHEWGTPGSLAYTLRYLIGAIIVFGLFVFRQYRAPEPLIPFAMFRNATFSSANMTNLFVGGALIIALVNIPLLSETLMGESALEGGLRLLRFTVMISIGAVMGGFICRRFGYRLPTMAGLVLSAIGFFWISGWPLEVADPEMTLHLVVCGLGFGLVIAPLASAAIDSVGEDQKGIASSLATTMRMIGMILGLAALTSWGMGSFHTMTAGMTLSELTEYPEELTDSVLALFHDFFLASVGICLAAILPALWLRRKKGT